MKLAPYKVHSFLSYQQLKNVFNDISHLHYAVVKGEVLSKLCYGECGKRKSGDIDILILRGEMELLENSLKKNGFFEHMTREERIFKLSTSHEIGPFINEQNGVETIVDINFDVLWGEYSNKRIDMMEFLSESMDINIYGVKVKTLPIIKQFIQLSLHHYKEMNSIYHISQHDCINVNMFKDVFLLWNNNKTNFNVDELYSECKNYGIIPYIFYMLYYTNEVFPNEELKKIIDKFESKEGKQLLDRYGLTKKEQHLWKVDFNTRLGEENLFNLIKNDLSDDELKKIEMNNRFFN